MKIQLLHTGCSQPKSRARGVVYQETIVNGRDLKAKAEALLEMIPRIDDNCNYAIYDNLQEAVCSFGTDIDEWPDGLYDLLSGSIGCILEINVHCTDDSGFWSFPDKKALYQFVCRDVPNTCFGDYNLVIK